MNEQSTGISQTEQKLSDDILEYGNVLNNPQNQTVVSMDEHRFVAVFLPMFAGDEVQHYREYGANIATWQLHAGGPFNEVRIVNKQGVELFRVPPIFNSNAIKPLDGTGQATGIPSIADMLARANMIAKQGPGAYDRYMREELERRSFMFTSENDETAYIQRWNEIFQRYNRPLIAVNATGQSTANDNNHERPVDFDSSEFDPIGS